MSVCEVSTHTYVCVCTRASPHCIHVSEVAMCVYMLKHCVLSVCRKFKHVNV